MVVIIILFMVVFVLCLQHLFTKRFCCRIENATPPQCSCSTPSPPSTSSQIAQFEEKVSNMCVCLHGSVISYNFHFITSLIFSSSAHRSQQHSETMREPPPLLLLLLLLMHGIMMSSWVFEEKILAKVLQAIYLRLCVKAVLIPSLIMTFWGEKKFQQSFSKPLNH